MNKTKPLHVRVTPDMQRVLDAIRQRDGIPVSEQLRRGLLLWIDLKHPDHSKAARS